MLDVAGVHALVGQFQVAVLEHVLQFLGGHGQGFLFFLGKLPGVPLHRGFGRNSGSHCAGTRHFLGAVPVFLHLSIFDSKHIERIVVICVRRISRVFGFMFEDEPNEVSLGARNHGHLVRRHGFGNGIDRFTAELREEFHEAGAPGIRIRIVLDVILGLIFGRNLEVARVEHLAPPVHHHVEVLFFLSRHGRDLRLGGRIDGFRGRSKSKCKQQNAGRPINRSHCRIPARISVSSVRRRCRHKWTAPSNPSAADRLRVGRDDGLSAGSEN